MLFLYLWLGHSEGARVKEGTGSLGQSPKSQSCVCAALYTFVLKGKWRFSLKEVTGLSEGFLHGLHGNRFPPSFLFLIFPCHSASNPVSFHHSWLQPGFLAHYLGVLWAANALTWYEYFIMSHSCMQAALGTARGDDWLGGSFPFAVIIELGACGVNKTDCRSQLLLQCLLRIPPTTWMNHLRAIREDPEKTQQGLNEPL